MKNGALERILKDIQRKKNVPEKRQEIDNIYAYINILLRYVQKVAKDHPEITTGQELYDFISEEIVELTKKYCRIGNVKGKLFQLEATQKLINNREAIEEIYERQKDKPSDPDFIYGFNLRGGLENVIKIAQEQIKINLETFSGYSEEAVEIFKRYLKSDRHTQVNLQRKYKDIIDLKSMEIFAPIIFENNYINKLNCELKIIALSIEDSVKIDQIEVMQLMGAFFKKIGLIDKWTENHNRKTKEITRASLEYEKSTGKYSKEELGVEEMFSKEFLETLSIEELLIYSSFWQNRFAKECDSINNAFFAMTDFKLWDEILKGKKIRDLDNDELAGLCKKERTLKKTIKLLITTLNENPYTKKEEIDGCIAIDSTKEILQYHNQEGELYWNIFRELLPESDNIFANDIDEYRTLIRQQENIYRIKNSILIYKITELFNSKRTKNWGVILEKNAVKDRVLIAIDYEGINMPLRLHLDKEELIKLLVARNGNALLPIYEGDKDFFKNIYGIDEEGKKDINNLNNLVKTTVLMPIKKEHRKSIKSRIKEIKDDNNPLLRPELDFLEHEEFLADQNKYPNHLKVNGKRTPRRYVDLNNGGIYVKNKETYVSEEEMLDER